MVNEGVWLRVETQYGETVLFFGNGGIIAVEPASVDNSPGSHLLTNGHVHYHCKWTPDIMNKMITDAREGRYARPQT